VASKTLTFTLIGKDGSASKSIQGVGRAAGGLTKVFAGVGAAIAGAFAIKRIVDFAKSTVTEFAAAEAAQTRLSDAFTRFPALADTSVAALRNLNEELMRTTRFDDDALAAGQAVLAQFGLTGKQLEELTPLLADYAAKTGQDIPTAAEQLGKGLLGQTRALKSIGIDFEDAGSVTENYALILAGLRTQVEGFANQDAATLIGKLEILKNGFGEVKESVGSLFAPAVGELSDLIYDTVLPSLDQLVERVGPRMKRAFEGGAELVGSFITALSDSSLAGNTKALSDFFDKLAADVPAVAVLKTILDTLAPVMPVLAEGLSELGETLTSEGVMDAISTLISELLPPLVELLVAIAPAIPPIADLLATILVPALQLTADLVNGLTSSIEFLAGGMTSAEFLNGIENLSILGGAFSLLMDSALNNMRGIAGVLNMFIGAVEGAVNGVRALAGLGSVRLPRFNIIDPRANPSQSGYTPGGAGAGGNRAMAEGGIVRASAGGISATIGEGLYDEAVVPLSPRNLAAMSGGGGGGGIHVTVQVPGGFVGDNRQLTQFITTAIRNGIKRGDISSGWATA
jgi:hypothetical protein